MTSSLVAVVAAIASSMWMCVPACADFNPFALWRMVQSESWAPQLLTDPPDRQYYYQPDFNVLPALHMTSTTHQGLFPPARADATTVHHSYMDGNSLHAESHGTASASALLTQAAYATSSSTVVMGFTITEPTSYDMSGHIGIHAADLPRDFSTGNVETYLYRLDVPNPTYLFHDNIWFANETRSMSRSGVLLPGEYRFSLNYLVYLNQSGAGQQSATGEFDVVFTVPTPAMPGLSSLLGLAFCVGRRR